MPKAVQFTQNSVVYFEGEKDSRIYILQSGRVVLSNTDIETGEQVNTQVTNGEFFGVKSALGRFPREETATAVVPSVLICLTVQEFETIFSNNKSLILKMLRVFSGQLRQIHKKTESILNNLENDQQTGMLSVAKSFYDDEQFRSAADIYKKFLMRYPHNTQRDVIAKKYQECNLKAQRLGSNGDDDLVDQSDESESSNLKIFELPAFERFAKNYEKNQVIISEFEPGDTFYLIQRGRVQLVKCVNGAKKNLDILKPGEIFGEMAILDNSPRSATCVAAGPVKCLEFNKENFQLLITGNPQIALHLLKLFCKRIYDQKRRFRILVLKDFQARMADVLLLLDEMNPVANENEKQRRFNVTMNDLAQWAGLPVDVVKDEIMKMASQRRLTVYDNYIIVTNINDIKRLFEARAFVGSR